MSNPTGYVKEVKSTADLKADGIFGYAKAILGALIIALGTAATAYSADQRIDGGEWIAIAVSFLVAAGGIWGVPNALKPVTVTGPAENIVMDNPDATDR